jgi:hypothetical protein
MTLSLCIYAAQMYLVAVTAVINQSIKHHGTERVLPEKLNK